MSAGHHHDDHHSTEQKPVAFTVPLILGCVALFAVVMFLSLCDPKPHHGGEHAHDAASKEASHPDAESAEHHASVEKADSMAVETSIPPAEPAHEAHH